MTSRRALACLLVAIAALGAPATAAAVTAPRTTWVTDGEVLAVAPGAAGITYIGGTFTWVGPRTGAAAVIDGGGAPALSGAQVVGSVHAAVADGSGGWFIGGAFSSVGGLPIANLAHLRGDGTLDEGWAPAPNGAVEALALSGGVLYLGGDFSDVGGWPRAAIAAVEAGSGIPTSWNPGANGSVLALAVSGATVYAGGTFNDGGNPAAVSIGGASRNRIAALDAATGLATTWNPNASGPVRALAISGSTIYAGGLFHNGGNPAVISIGGASRTYLAALDAGSGLATAWDPAPNYHVYALGTGGAGLYIGGAFSMVGAQARDGLAEIDGLGTVTGWNPDAGSTVDTLAVSGGTVYAGGHFTTIGASTRRRLAAIAAGSGAVTSWDPGANGVVRAIALSGGKVLAGGDLSGVGGQPRNRLAAIDGTGVATTWNPGADGAVRALAVSGATVYAGGDFITAGGAARSRLAAFTALGAATAWNPGANAPVRALAVSGSTVYAGGDFTSAGAQGRNFAAAFATSGNAALPWNPDASNSVNALLVDGATVYAAGLFTTIGGAPRLRAAALSSTGAGAATDFAADANAPVRALAISGSTVYLGGDFTAIGVDARMRLAAVDSVTGALAAWAPSAGGPVRAMVATGPTVYAGGDFTTVAGLARARLVALDAVTGVPTAWDPGANASVRALGRSGSTIAAGGAFGEAGATPQAGYAEFNDTAPLNTLAPQISGIAAVGETVTCSTGTWTGAPTSYAWQWLRDGTAIGGATAGTYILGVDDAGRSLVCRVTAANAGGATTAFSAPVAVPPLPPANVELPSLQGTVAVGYTALCAVGRWIGPPSSYAYAWLRDAVPIPGATGSVRTTTDDDQGHALSCSVTASNAAGVASADSPAVGVPYVAPAVIGAPQITGILASGNVLTCSNGSWTGAPTAYAYAWLRESMPLVGQTAATYLLTPYDAGRAVTCRVTATNLGGSTTASSTPVGIAMLPPSNTVLPYITGTLGVGGMAVCNPGTWIGPPTAYGYAWLRDGKLLAGAAGAAYAIATADDGHTLACRVTGTNPSGTATADSLPVSISGVAGGPGGGGGGPGGGAGGGAGSAGGAGGSAASRDKTAPRARIAVPVCPRKAKRCLARIKTWQTVRGTATDNKGGTGAKRVELNIVRKAGKRCIVYKAGRWVSTTCAKARATWARTTVKKGRWALLLRKLGKGTFSIRVRAIDGAGNVQRGFPAGSTRTLKLTRK